MSWYFGNILIFVSTIQNIIIIEFLNFHFLAMFRDTWEYAEISHILAYIKKGVPLNFPLIMTDRRQSGLGKFTWTRLPCDGPSPASYSQKTVEKRLFSQNHQNFSLKEWS